jgi:hypothetical protein
LSVSSDTHKAKYFSKYKRVAANRVDCQLTSTHKTNCRLNALPLEENYFFMRFLEKGKKILFGASIEDQPPTGHQYLELSVKVNSVTALFGVI